jgi:type IV pilus assembly protein PilP
MKTTFKIPLQLIQSRTAAGFSLMLCCSLLFLPTGNLAAVAPSAEKPEASAQKAGTAESKPFVYEMANRPDPFLPFITEKTTDQGTVDPNEIVEKKEALTGMQIFEPGQLSLVALLNTEGQKYAMVQDFTGKGYIITEGTKIGKRGVVKTIEPNKVLIEETAETRAGKKIVTYIDMILKKEGEK